jgi:thiosulfate dehydrogenase (quinone) large subunit
MATATTERSVYIEEPRLARWVFGSSQAAWIWLIARLWLGWEWFQVGWTKVVGGNITWRFWDWGDDAYSLTGDGNIGWIREGTVDGQRVEPDVAYSWYVDFLEWIEKTAHPVLGPLVAVGELVIGIALILGLFTGIAAFLGSTLNFSFVFAGSAGINPAMLLVSGALILAWRNAGWYGLDRWVLPAVGTPWHRGERIDAQILERDSAPARGAGRSSPRPPDDD